MNKLRVDRGAHEGTVQTARKDYHLSQGQILLNPKPTQNVTQPLRTVGASSNEDMSLAHAIGVRKEGR